jgi:uncharacterized protein YidB (DUF937 family)
MAAGAPAKRPRRAFVAAAHCVNYVRKMGEENMGLLDGILGGVVGAEVANLVSGVIAHHGGVQGLMAQFEQQGLGGVMQSWIGNGPNQAISADQLQKVLGNDALVQLAGKFGINPQDLLQKVAAALPQAVDKLTPNGVVPAA